MPLREWQVTQRLSVVGVEIDARSCAVLAEPCGSWQTTQTMRSSLAESFSTNRPVTPNRTVRADFPSWHGAQEALAAATAKPGPEPWADCFHWSTNGSCTPV